MVDNQKINVLVLGATGKLGSLVVKHALQQPNLIVHIQLRDPQKSPELVKQVQNAGGRVIQADLNQPHTLQDSTKGIHTIISCSSLFSEQDVQGQLNILDDAVKNGVKRFFSSHFGISYEHVSPGNLLIDSKLKFSEQLAKTNIKPVIISNGLLLDFILQFNNQGLRYYGDINQKVDLTTYDDVARFVVAIAVDPEKSGSFNFVGEELSTKEIVEIYNRVRGAQIKAQSAGSIEELEKTVEEQRKAGEVVAAAFSGIFELVYGGKGKIRKIDNKEFPGVKTTSLEEYLKQNPAVTIA